MSKPVATTNGVICIDFTDTIASFNRFHCFDEEVIDFIRDIAKDPNGPKTILIVDHGFGFEAEAPHIVSDHLNLTGDNPLVGPNDPCGERFPILKDTYKSDVLLDLHRGVAVGLKQGVLPTQEEVAMIRFLGGDFCCYNLVPAMIVAGHAGIRVMGVVVPETYDTSLLVPALESVAGKEKAVAE
jgi:purine-nucleoside phosphorylase